MPRSLATYTGRAVPAAASLLGATKRVAARALGPRFAARRLVARHLRTGEPELRLLPLLCDRSTAFLDLGANAGAYSMLAARTSRHVYAVEPHPALARRLRAALVGHGTVFDLAASDREGTSTLHIPLRDGQDVHWRSSVEPEANPGFASREVTVRLRPVDSLDLPTVGVVKIDVEGHELAALRGARGLLVRDRPVVIVESEERHRAGSVEEVRQFLEELGYEGHYLHRGAVRPIADFDPGRLQSPETQKAVGGDRSPDYVNNFVYLHPTDPRRPTFLAYTGGPAALAARPAGSGAS